MHVLAVNIGKGEHLQVGDRALTTGIFKRPVTGRVPVGPLGLQSDQVLDGRFHGGVDQAVYAYSASDYAWWEEQLGRRLSPGTFGENLTLSSFGTDTVRIGDHYRVGTVLLEVTGPRTPCSVFAARMGDAAFVKKFLQANRSGFYARVLQPGDVGEDDAVEHLPSSSDRPTIQEVLALFHEKQPDPERLRWVLRAPLAERLRDQYERRLARVSAQR